MTDRDIFLRAIRANPADNVRRLAFADWLDEHDEPAWAEFVRLQIELPSRASLDPYWRDRGRYDLTTREITIRAAHSDDWLGPAARLETGGRPFEIRFDRGVPERAVVSLDLLLEAGAELFGFCPSLRELAVYDVRDRGADLAACEHIAGLDVLEIADYPTAEDWRALVWSKFFDAHTLRVWESATGAPPDFLDLIWPAVWRPRYRLEIVRFLPPADDRRAERAALRLNDIWGIGVTEILWVSLVPVTVHSGADHPRVRTGRRGGHFVLAVLHPNGGGADVFRFRGDALRQTIDVRRQYKLPGQSFDVWLAKVFGFVPGVVYLDAFRDDARGYRLERWTPEGINQMLAELHTGPRERDTGGEIKLLLDRGPRRFVVPGGGFPIDRFGRILPAGGA